MRVALLAVALLALSHSDTSAQEVRGRAVILSTRAGTQIDRSTGGRDAMQATDGVRDSRPLESLHSVPGSDVPIVLGPDGFTFSDPFLFPLAVEAVAPTGRSAGSQPGALAGGAADPGAGAHEIAREEPTFEIAAAPSSVEIYDPGPAESTRIVTTPEFTLYFSGNQPVYLRYEPRRGCLLEYDYGLGGNRSQTTGPGAAVLHAPAWGQLQVRNPRPDLVELDLTGVRLPGCPVPAGLRFERTGQGWQAVR